MSAKTRIVVLHMKEVIYTAIFVGLGICLLYTSKILQQFGCDKFIYCSDAGLASEDNRVLNHMGQRAFIVTQSIKKLPAEDRAWALKLSLIHIWG